MLLLVLRNLMTHGDNAYLHVEIEFEKLSIIKIKCCSFKRANRTFALSFAVTLKIQSN